MATKTKAKSGNQYHLHRERQRRRILEAARALFDERGIDRTTMADIMSASELRASTLYEYFSNKDEIVWAILSEVLEEVAAGVKDSIQHATTGLCKIVALLQYMAGELSHHQARIRFMAQFDAMYARDWPVERLLTLEGQLNKEGFKVFGRLIREGIADGSLRPDLNPDLTLHAVVNAVLAAQRRLASLGKKVELEYGQPIDRLFRETIRIIELGLRADGHAKNIEPGVQAKTRKSPTRKRNSLKHLWVVIALSCSLVSPGQTSSRLELAADSGWRFSLGDASGAEAPTFADNGWRSVDLPHDWSIEGRPEKGNASGSGEGFFPAGIGWYRKTFQADAGWRGKRVSIEFDGVYRNSTVYLNGHALGNRPYGYTSFAYDLTPGLNFNGANVLAVRVDNSAQPNSRWYTGSGIYRHIRVVVTDPIHVAHWGVFVTTPKVSDTTATVSIQTEVANESDNAPGVTVATTLFDSAGNREGSSQVKLPLKSGSGNEASATITVSHPALWSPASPSLYRAVTQISRGGEVVDEVVTRFGIRSLSWSAETGLLLNGKAVKLSGGSVHDDNGPLGAAAFDRAEDRKVELLKAAGYNAVRTAHNPPSPAFLDACDRLGLLVLDEPFDTWKANKVKFDYGINFDEWWKKDVSALILRDRNHPSIVIWGIGNEIPELETERGKDLGKQLADLVRSLDSTRPLTLAFPGTTTLPTAEAVFSQLDITGYNYNILPTYAADHEKLPNRIMLTTESYPAKVFPLWQVTQDNTFILGDLTWTAMDYLGESGIGAWAYGTPEQAKMAELMMNGMVNTSTIDKMFTGMANGVDMMSAVSKGADPAIAAAMALLFPGYPWHASACGDLDLTGFRKPQSYYRDILWNGGDRVYATVRLPEPDGKKIIAVGWSVYPTLPSWSWPGQEGKDMQVEVYSGAEKVRLFLNDQLIGEKPTGREQEFKAVFSVPFAPGTLKAVGMRGDRAVAESVLTTAGKASALRVTADRTVVQADGQDLSFLTIEAVDADGRVQLGADEEVQFSIGGAGTIAAVGNGDGQDDASYQGTQRKLFQGRALVVVRTSRQSGPITVKATSPGLSDGSVTIQAKAVEARAELR